MAAERCCSLEFFPDNIVIDILSYLNVRELVRNSRVCRRWRLLVKDQRLWRFVDLSSWKGVSSRVLWVLLRQYLGRGLLSLRLRGLLLSARGGSFLSEPWLKALGSRCPRLRHLSLLHADLRGLHSVRLLPASLQALELRCCEVPPGFFSAPAAPSGLSSADGVSVASLVLDSVPSFSDQHLRSLSSWPCLECLELRDLIRVTVSGLKACVPPGPQTLARLRALELQTGTRAQMLALGLGEGWAGLQRLGLGGKEVSPGLLCLSRLTELTHLRLSSCKVTTLVVQRSCRCVPQLRVLEFTRVEFVEEAVEQDDADGAQANTDLPVRNFQRSLQTLLPHCAMSYNSCIYTRFTG